MWQMQSGGIRTPSHLVRLFFLKESTGLWLKARITGAGVICRWEHAASGHILFPVNYCRSSSCDLWEAICVNKTPALTVSCLFVLPEDDAKHFTPALESQLNEYACNKKLKGCKEKIRIIAAKLRERTSGCCLLFFLKKVLKNTKKKKKAASRHPPHTWRFAASPLWAPSPFS